jgi:hypothetical protein
MQLQLLQASLLGHCSVDLQLATNVLLLLCPASWLQAAQPVHTHQCTPACGSIAQQAQTQCSTTQPPQHTQVQQKSNAKSKSTPYQVIGCHNCDWLKAVDGQDNICEGLLCRTCCCSPHVMSPGPGDPAALVGSPLGCRKQHEAAGNSTKQRKQQYVCGAAGVQEVVCVLCRAMQEAAM